jgi:hypothetical protein
MKFLQWYLCERQSWWNRTNPSRRHIAQGNSSRRIQQPESGFSDQAEVENECGLRKRRIALQTMASAFSHSTLSAYQAHSTLTSRLHEFEGIN